MNDPTPDPKPHPPIARRAERPRSNDPPWRSRDDDRPRRRRDPVERRDEPRPSEPAEPKPPTALFYLRLFCVFVCLLLIGAVCFMVYASGVAYTRRNSDGDLWMWMLVCGGIQLVVFFLFTIPLWVRMPQKRDWWYGLILIIVSCLTLYLSVFSLLLLIGWLLPSTRAYYFAPVKSPTPEAVS